MQANVTLYIKQTESVCSNNTTLMTVRTHTVQSDIFMHVSNKMDQMNKTQHGGRDKENKKISYT